MSSTQTQNPANSLAMGTDFAGKLLRPLFRALQNSWLADTNSSDNNENELGGAMAKRGNAWKSRRMPRNPAKNNPFGVDNAGVPIRSQQEGDEIEYLDIPEKIQDAVSKILREHGLSKVD